MKVSSKEYLAWEAYRAGDGNRTYRLALNLGGLKSAISGREERKRFVSESTTLKLGFTSTRKGSGEE